MPITNPTSCRTTDASLPSIVIRPSHVPGSSLPATDDKLESSSRTENCSSSKSRNTDDDDDDDDYADDNADDDDDESQALLDADEMDASLPSIVIRPSHVSGSSLPATGDKLESSSRTENCSSSKSRDTDDDDDDADDNADDDDEESQALLDADEMDDLKKRLQDMQSQIESLNSKGDGHHREHQPDSEQAVAAQNAGIIDPHQRSLSRDTFSIMAFSRPTSIPFLWSIIIFFIQILTFTLVAINVIDLAQPDNPLEIPPNVEFSVRITQLLALIIAGTTQEDIRTAVNMIYDGYQAETFKMFEGFTFGLWITSVTCRFLEGSLGLVVTFFLVVSEEAVIELLLNFTAMEFVSQLDEVAFYLSTQGYLGMRNQLKAETVLSSVYFIQKKPRRWLRILLLLTILIPLLFGWTLVIRNQQTGAYLCSRVFVQFSDEFDRSLGTFSGVYLREDLATGLRSIRPIYVERRSRRAHFSYCDKERAWTFSKISGDDPCDDWTAISQETASFDLLEAGSLEWFVKSDTFAGLVPLEYFEMFCYDCDELADVTDQCGGRGTCEDNGCTCEEMYFGLQCEFAAPCPKISRNEYFNGFVGTRNWSDEYTVLRTIEGSLVTAYDRPVYINEFEEGNFDIILFTGRRWIATFLTETFLRDDGIGGEINILTVPKFQGDHLLYFLSNFHGHYSRFSSVFISAPVDVGRVSNAATPIHKDWFQASAKPTLQKNWLLRPATPVGLDQFADENFPLDVVFLCATCNNETELCRFNSACSSDGVCECTTGARGTRCQIAPVANGKCNPFFNTQGFNFDGGDCCESTCVSSDDFVCGKDDTGFVDIGYPICGEPVNTWMPSGESIISTIGRFARTGTALAISDNGAVLAVSEPGYDLVRLFDKDGSRWIQRGRTLEGGTDSGFGATVALAGGAGNIVRNPSSANAVTLAVGDSSSVWLYNCDWGACSLYESGQLEGGPSLALSGNGRTIAFPKENNIQVYDRVGSEAWSQSRPVIMEQSFRKLSVGVAFRAGRYLSLSAAGNILAVGSVSLELGFAKLGKTLRSADLRVTVYRYDSTWVELGTFESDSHSYASAEDDLPVKSIALSDDGTVLAIGSKYLTDDPQGGHVSAVQIYAWNGIGWIDRGRLNGGNMTTAFGWGVDLSSDGSVLAVSSDDSQEDTSALVFQWKGGTYEQLWNDLPGGKKAAVALSDDGSAVAVGLPFSGGSTGGSATVYGTLFNCPDGTVSFRVSLTTDATASQTRWDVVDGLGNTVLEGRNYLGAEFNTIVEEVCFDLTNECAIFTIFDDREADGIDSPGGYAIIVDGKVIAEEGKFGSYQRLYFGQCSCAEGESRLRLSLRVDQNFLIPIFWAIDGAEGESLFEGGPYDVATVLEEYCIPVSYECLRVAITGGGCADVVSSTDRLDYALFVDDNKVDSPKIDNLRCEERFMIGNCSAVEIAEPLQCEAGFELLHIQVFHQFTPQAGHGWNVMTCNSTTTLLEGGPYRPTDFEQFFVTQTCIAEGQACVLFSYTDDGFVLYTVQKGDLMISVQKAEPGTEIVPILTASP